MSAVLTKAPVQEVAALEVVEKAVEKSEIEARPPLLDRPMDLPTFPMEVGYREIYDPQTKTFSQLPLTLLELLYPIDEDVGVVTVADSPLHDILVTLLTTMLRVYLGARDWLITSNVIVHWGYKRAPYKSPDISAMLGGKVPDIEEKSYRVGRDGPLPSFVVEITSEETRHTDLYEKNLLYAAVGVKEYLIIDILANRRQKWNLIGYRLDNRPRYKKLTPDEEGGLRFETVGLRFVGIGNERIDIFDLATGERLLRPGELKLKAEAEAARADAEAARADAEVARADAEAARADAEAARADAEAQARAALEAQVAELTVRLTAQGSGVGD